MKHYIIEFALSENVESVNAWDMIDGLEDIEAESPEEAAKIAACTDGLEKALFKVREVRLNDFEEMDAISDPLYYSFYD